MITPYYSVSRHKGRWNTRLTLRDWAILNTTPSGWNLEFSFWSLDNGNGIINEWIAALLACKRASPETWLQNTFYSERHTYMHTYNFDVFMVPPVVGYSLTDSTTALSQFVNESKRLTNELLKRLPFSTVQKKSVEPHFPPLLVSTKFIRLTDTG